MAEQGRDDRGADGGRERDLRAVFDHTLDAILLADDRGRYVDANPAACALLGYDRGELLRLGVFDVTPPPDAETGRAAWAAFLRDGRQSGEYTLRRRDGTTAVVEYRAVANVTPGVHLSVLRDVTDRRRVERRRAARLAVPQALAEAGAVEEAAPAILAALCGGLGWDVGAFWRVDAAAAALRCVHVWHDPGLPVPEFAAASRRTTLGPGVGLPGRVWAAGRPVWFPDAAAEANFPRAAAAGRDGVRGACGFPVAVGGEFLGAIEFFSREVREPDPDLLEMMATVGSQVGQFMERTRAEADLRRSERELADFFDNATVGLHWVGPDGVILRANRAELDLLGYAAGEYVGHHIAEFHADEEVICDILRRLAAGEELHDREARMRCKDGSVKHVLINSNVLWEDGRFVHTRCFTRDVTDRKRAEQALREADRRKDEFLATLAHELRNPLAPIRNALQVVKLAAGDAAAVARARGVMERQLAQMVRLIDDLLDVSRITRGQLHLRRERVDLAAVVRSAVEASRPLVEAAAHRLTVALPPDPVPLDADPTRLAQVFANLLTNAAKYTDPGGHIRLTAECGGGAVAVAVADTGIGIPAEHLPRLFEMFSQVAPALERSQGGLGIGLSLVRRLVELHGGTVAARSDGPGQGSTFVVRLPLASAEYSVRSTESGHRSTEHSALSTPAKRRILVADDNRDAADSLAMLLRLAGHDVVAARDGLEAVEAAGWFRPDVALLDIGMPRLNGLEAARRIRAAPWGRQVVLVAVTGWGQEEDKRRATAAGFDRHLTKPVDPAALETLLAGGQPE